MTLIWDKKFNLGIKIIDDQHKYFVSVLNELLASLGDPKNSKQLIENVFKKLSDYINFHFATEEKYFKQFNYQDAEEHIAKHNEFKQKIESLKQEYIADQISTQYSLADYLEDWLLDHLATMDKKYVECFHSHGLY